MEKRELVELHAHISSSVNPAVLWSIAHAGGIKLPYKDYREFEKHIVLTLNRKTTLKEYLDTVYHPVLNPLTSGTYAVEKAIHETLGGAYRSSAIAIYELRMNPMKHNSGGREDLDHIIMAALRGMERALLEYPQIQAGLIFCMDRQFSIRQNEIIAEKAMKYHKRGVIGVDFANYNKGGFSFKDYTDIIKECKKAGLGVTVHTGETDDTNDMGEAIEYLQPQRIGHGIRAAYDKNMMKELVRQEIVLEICPLSNLVTQAVKNVEELKHIIRTFVEHHVKFTINTDWPETVENAHLNEQITFLEKHGILDEREIAQCIETAQKATFTKGAGIEAYL
jgi:adenosine deaminase